MDYPDLKHAHQRLQWARKRKYPASAVEASTALHVNMNTYKSYENGTRNFNADEAKVYARAYGIDWLWLLYGREVLRRQALTAEEAALLEKYRRKSRIAREAMHNVADAFPDQKDIAG